MNIRTKLLWPALVLLFAAGMVSLPGVEARAEEPVVVGRIAFLEGEVLRYVPDTQDWVAVVKDAPFGINDALYSGPEAKGEFIMPNGVWSRIGPSTQMQLIVLKNDVGEIDVASGVSRFYNKGPGAALKVTTPYGYILSEPGSSFDLYVGDQSLEVIALDGGISFIHTNNTKYDLTPGSGSIIADANQVATGSSTVDASWDEWNVTRDNLWAKRTEVKGESISYLPPQLHDDAYELEQSGTWEKVHYEGEYRTFWRPVNVREDWRPFTRGRWTEYYGDQCWVPDESFGYVTHHYGNWVIVNGRWFWAPPAPRVVVVGAAPVVEYGWYPGRVAWISSDDNIGWVPLAPAEPYYSYHYWGPRATVIGAAPAAAIAVGALAFATAAVVVPRDHFWGVRDYSRVHVTNINRTVIINNYRAAPVINNTVIKNYKTAPNKYNFTMAPVTHKPYVDVAHRVEQNRQMAIKQAPRITAAAVKQQAVAAKPPAAPPQSAKQLKLPPPQASNKLVPLDKVNAPKNQMQFKPTQLMSQPKAAPTSTPLMTKPAATGTTVKPGVTPPTAPGATAPSGVKPGTTGPSGIPTLKTQPTPPTLKPGTPGAVTQPTVPGKPTTPTFKPGTTAPSGTATPRTRPAPPTFKPATPGTTHPGAVTRPTVPGKPTTPTVKPGTGTTRPGSGVTRPTTPRRTTPSVTSPTRRTPTTQPSRTLPPGTTRDRATQPRVTQPRTMQPHVTQPRTMSPAATQPRFTQPPRTQPRVTTPQRTMPQMQRQPRMTSPPVRQQMQQPRMTSPPVRQQMQQPRMTSPPVRQPPKTAPQRKDMENRSMFRGGKRHCC